MVSILPFSPHFPQYRLNNPKPSLSQPSDENQRPGGDENKISDGMMTQVSGEKDASLRGITDDTLSDIV